MIEEKDINNRVNNSVNEIGNNQNKDIIEKNESLKILNDMKKCVIDYGILYEDVQNRIMQNEKTRKEIEDNISEKYDKKGRLMFCFIGFIAGDIIGLCRGGIEAITIGIEIFKVFFESPRMFIDDFFNNNGWKELFHTKEFYAFTLAIVFAILGYFIGHKLYQIVMSFVDQSKSSKANYLEVYTKGYDIEKQELQNRLNVFWNMPENARFKNIIPMEYMNINVIEKLIYIIDTGKANNIKDALKILKNRYFKMWCAKI